MVMLMILSIPLNGFMNHEFSIGNHYVKLSIPLNGFYISPYAQVYSSQSSFNSIEWIRNPLRLELLADSVAFQFH